MERQQQQQQQQLKAPDEKLSLDVEHSEPKTLTREQIKRARAAAALHLAVFREERNNDTAGEARRHGYSGSKGGEGALCLIKKSL